MSKKSSYQKLKDRNATLKHHIYAMIMQPDKLDTIIIKTQYLQMFGLEKVIWSGSVSKELDYSKFDGLIKEIQKQL